MWKYLRLKVFAYAHLLSKAYIQKVVKIHYSNLFNFIITLQSN